MGMLINPYSFAVAGGGMGPIVQYKTVLGDNLLDGGIVLPAPPTAGNKMVFLGTHWNSSRTVRAGWTQDLQTNGSVTDGELVVWKIADATDALSASVKPLTNDDGGSIGVLFEVAGMAAGAGVLTHFKEVSGTNQALSPVFVNSGSLLIGFFGTLGQSAAPSSITNVTLLPNTSGTTTNASPRQITPFYKTPFNANLTTTPTYGVSSNQYGASYVISP